MTTLLSSLRRAACLFALSLLAVHPGFAAAPDHWVGTWATADVDRANPKGDFGSTDMTLREIVHISLGGSAVRIELSNRFGTEPLTIAAAHLAVAESSGDIKLPTANKLSFGGKDSIIIPPGADVISDPVSLKIEPFTDLAISIFLPAQKITHETVHNSAFQTNYLAPGNVVGEKSLPAADAGTKKVANWFFLKAVDVMAPADAAAVIAFGDSITDGSVSTPDANHRWPDFLARRLHADKKTANLGVLNLGIGGNRVLHDGTGPSALARFDDDVLAQSGAKYMIVLESINDIGHSFDTKKPFDPITAADLIQGLTQLVERAHAHGIKVFGATLTPYFSATDPTLSTGYSSAAGEAVRQAVNQWIRTSKVFDGVIDFEGATIDKATGSWRPEYNKPKPGDSLHPNDAGMEAMANSIDLKLFSEK